MEQEENVMFYTIITVVSYLLANGMTTYVQFENTVSYDTYLDCMNRTPFEQRTVAKLLDKGAVPRPETAVERPKISTNCYYLKNVG